MPALTFAIPFYRNHDYLRRAVDSVFRQTVSDWRLIVSDDAGPEGDLAAWIATLPHQEKLTYIRQPFNLGIAGNWNSCLERASTDLVTLLHADDELDPRYAETMLAAAQRHPAASVYFCQALVIDAHGMPAFSFPDWYKRWLLPARGREFVIHGEQGLRAVFKGNFIMCPTMCYRRRDLFEPAFDVRWKQVLDLDLIARLLLDGRELVGLPEIRYHYRRHEANATKLQSDSLLRFEEERDLYGETAARATSKNWTAAAATCRRRTIVKCNLAFCVAQDVLRLRPTQALSKARFLANLFLRGSRP